MAIQVVSRAAQKSLPLKVKNIFEYQDIANLAAFLEKQSAVKENKYERPTGNIPLGPIQKAFFQQPEEVIHHFNQAVLLELTSGIDIPTLQKAFDMLAGQFDAFRIRFSQNEGNWTSYYLDNDIERFDFQIEDFSTSTPEDFDKKQKSTLN